MTISRYYLAVAAVLAAIILAPRSAPDQASTFALDANPATFATH